MYFEDIDYCRRLKNTIFPYTTVRILNSSTIMGRQPKELAKRSLSQLIASSKIYHGKFRYSLLTAILWLGQKWARSRPLFSKWEKNIEINMQDITDGFEIGDDEKVIEILKSGKVASFQLPFLPL